MEFTIVVKKVKLMAQAKNIRILGSNRNSFFGKTKLLSQTFHVHDRSVDCNGEPGPVFMKGLSQGLGLKLRLLSQVSAQKLLNPLS